MKLARLLLLVAALGCGDDDTRIEGTEPGDCSDGADNDADGAFDCDDLGCAGAPACAPVDGGPVDSGTEDAGETGDAGETDACVATMEMCNGIDDDCDGEVDDGCCEESTPLVDLLLVIDDSGDAADAQAALTTALPGLLEKLSSGDLDGDGSAELAGADVHAAVVSTDMGTGGITAPTCANATFGDDGILQTSGATSDDCDATYPQVVELAPSGDAAAAATDLVCLASQGNGGCGFIQPLEAALKALTPSTSAIRFHEDTTGHADSTNDGFRRAGAILVVVFLTTADDCTAEDFELYQISGGAYAGTAPNLRCGLHPEALKALERFESGLLATVSEPRDLVYGVLGGIPEAIDTEAPATILADEAMTLEEHETMAGRLALACSGSTVEASPSRRLVQLAGALADGGAATVTRSVCRDSHDSFVDALLTEIDVLVGPACE